MIRPSLIFVFCLLVPLVEVNAQEILSARYTGPAFLFLWPDQSDADAEINLNGPIVTDRPDFTEASSPVGEGVLQAELGYTFYHDSAAPPNQSSHVFPELLLRRGVLADWLELRFGETLITLDEERGQSTGFADMYLGAKLGIVPQFGIIPELSVVPQFTIPTGAADQRADRVLYGVNILYSWSVLKESYIGASTQFNQREDDGPGELYTSFAQAIVAGTRWTSRWGSYADWFALFADKVAGGADAHYVNGGLTYLFSKDLQLDVRLGSRIQDRFGEEIFAGFGLFLSVEIFCKNRIKLAILVGGNVIAEDSSIFNVGATLPLSGPLADFGTAVRNGMELGGEIMSHLLNRILAYSWVTTHRFLRSLQ